MIIKYIKISLIILTISYTNCAEITRKSKRRDPLKVRPRAELNQNVNLKKLLILYYNKIEYLQKSEYLPLNTEKIKSIFEINEEYNSEFEKFNREINVFYFIGKYEEIFKKITVENTISFQEKEYSLDCFKMIKKSLASLVSIYYHKIIKLYYKDEKIIIRETYVRKKFKQNNLDDTDFENFMNCTDIMLLIERYKQIFQNVKLVNSEAITIDKEKVITENEFDEIYKKLVDGCHCYCLIQ